MVVPMKLHNAEAATVMAPKAIIVVIIGRIGTFVAIMDAISRSHRFVFD